MQSYIYALGTTLFTAMHFELENGKVSSFIITTPPPSPSPPAIKIMMKSLMDNLSSFLLFPIQEPMVGSQLNAILLKMVDESVETRASFSDLRDACSHQRLDDSSVKDEVNKLVTYVMGTAPEVRTVVIKMVYRKILFVQLSSSEYGDTDMDDANLESEVCQLQFFFCPPSISSFSPPLFFLSFSRP